MANVEVEVEVGVFDPVRPVEFERHFDDLAAKWFEMANHDPESIADFSERIKVRRRPFVNRQPVDVPVRVRCFHQQEADVRSGELFQHAPINEPAAVAADTISQGWAATWRFVSTDAAVTAATLTTSKSAVIPGNAIASVMPMPRVTSSPDESTLSAIARCFVEVEPKQPGETMTASPCLQHCSNVQKLAKAPSQHYEPILVACHISV